MFIGKFSGRGVEKPWGSEEIWAQNAGYVGKVLRIREGGKLSLQHHVVKDETIRILSGTMLLLLDGPDGDLVTHVMQAGDVAHIPPGARHRMVGVTDVEVLEVSTNHLNDVVRHQDDYGRAEDASSTKT